MSKQLAIQLTTVLATLAVVNAHGYVVTWTVNDGSGPKEMKGFDPSWVQEPGGTAQRPYFNKERGFADYHKIDVACGGPDAGTKLETWPVAAGTDVTATWDQWPTAHEGPIMQYMAPCPSTGCDGVDAAGLPWFKISEDAWLGDKWATDKLNETATWTFKIPEAVTPGPYLIRHEIIAMHYAHEPQVYPVCFQAQVSGSGSSVPDKTVTFPDAYASESISDDFETFDVHDQKADKGAYVPPGPAVAVLAQGAGAAQPAASSDAPSSPSASGTAGAAPSPSSVKEESTPASSDMPVISSQAGEPVSSPVEPSAPSPSAVVDAAQPSPPAANGVPDDSSADVSMQSPAGTPAGTASIQSSATGRGRGKGHRRPGHPRTCASKAA